MELYFLVRNDIPRKEPLDHMDLVSRVNLTQTEEILVTLQEGNKQSKPGVRIVSRVGLRQVEARTADPSQQAVVSLFLFLFGNMIGIQMRNTTGHQRA